MQQAQNTTNLKGKKLNGNNNTERLTTNGSNNEKTSKTKEDNLSNYDWSGVYEGTDESNNAYTLTISNEGPMRWTEFGFKLEGVGIQLYFIVSGYANRNNDGTLDLHYMDTDDGVFFQKDEMDINKTMFLLEKRGNEFIPINGNWKIDYYATKSFKKVGP